MSANFELDEIAALLKLLRDNDVREFKLEREGDRLWLRRGEIAAQVVSYQPPANAHAAVAAPVAAEPGVAAPAVAVATPTPAPPQKHLHEVKSPMVGTFYRRPAPDAAPFVDVGASIRKGQVLCIVEAMKLMNEIESDCDGVVSQVRLNDGQMAEYGEVLFLIDPAS